MTLILELPPAVEQAIAEAAQQHGLTPEQQAQESLKSMFLPAVEGDSQTASQPKTAAEAFAGLVGIFSYESVGYDDTDFADGMMQKHKEKQS